MAKAQTFAQLAATRGLVAAEVLKSGDGPKFVPIRKAGDAQKGIVYGWVAKSTEGGKPVVDSQGDHVPVDHLVDAAHDFITKRTGLHQHAGTKAMEMVESVVFTKQMQDAMGIDLGFEGWLAGFKLLDPVLKALHAEDKLTGFSMGGAGLRTPMKVTA